MTKRKDKFWYSANQRKWFDYVDNILSDRPPQGRSYAVIDGVLTEYTECYGGDDDAYAPNYDDVVFLGTGEYACNDWNIQTYMRTHPEVRFKEDEWPDVIIT